MAADASLKCPATPFQDLGHLFQSGTLTGLNDAELLDRYLNDGGTGQAELAFAMVVERHGGMVLRTCKSIVGNADDAEDAFQVTFLVLARNARSLRKRASLAAWLHSVAVRTAKALRASAERRRRKELLAASLLTRAAVNDLAERVQHEVSRLPTRFREVVVLCEFEGLSQEEAASRLGCAEGTIKSRLFRARAKLRKRLKSPTQAFAGIAPTISPVLIRALTRAALGDSAFVTSVRVSVLRSTVLKGMLMKKVQVAALAVVVIALGVAASGYYAVGGGADDSTAKAVAVADEPMPKAASEKAKVLATFIKRRAEMAEAAWKDLVSRRGKEEISDEEYDNARDRYLLTLLDLKEDQTERTAILRERLQLANRRVAEANRKLERGAVSAVDVNEALFHQLGVAIQLAQLADGSRIQPDLLQAIKVENDSKVTKILSEFISEQNDQIVHAELARVVELQDPLPTTLEQFLKAIKGASIGPYDSGNPMYIDPVGLSNAGITIDAPIHLTIRKGTVNDLLNSVLNPLGLKQGVANGLNLIESK